MEAKKKIEQHKKLSEHYFQNAIEYINKRDAEKASEFLWGTITQAIKAMAAKKNIWLRSHSQIKKYTLELARELGDDSLRNAFDHAQALHSNFYESGLEIEDVVLGAEDVKKAVKKLFDLL